MREQNTTAELIEQRLGAYVRRWRGVARRNQPLCQASGRIRRLVFDALRKDILEMYREDNVLPAPELREKVQELFPGLVFLI